MKTDGVSKKSIRYQKKKLSRSSNCPIRIQFGHPLPIRYDTLYLYKINFIKFQYLPTFMKLRPTFIFKETATKYLSGSQIIQRDSVTENIKPFGFPGSKFSRICTESPIRFKLDQEDSCLTKNNAANCLLSGQQAFTNIQVDAIGDETSFVSPVIACFDSAGSSTSCLDSNFDASTCENAIVNSRYIIRTDSNTGYISQGIDFSEI